MGAGVERKGQFMSSRLIAIAGAALLLLSVGVIGVTRAEAGPPDHYANLSVDQVELGPDCVARIAWSGLIGGKPLFIQRRLAFNNGMGYQTSFGEGANLVHRVKQNADYLEVNLSAAAMLDPTTDHRLSVSFMNRTGTHVRPIEVSYATC